MAEKEYAYFCGCSLEGTAKEYDESIRAVMKALGVSLVEPDDWSCCGSTPAHTVSHVFAAALAARNLSLVEKMNKDVLTTPCPSCLMAFKKAQHGMSGSEEFKAEVNELLDEPYDCGVESKSSLQIIYEDIGPEEIAARVTHIMPDLKVAPYYGCILSRPPEIANFDDPENPVSMDNLLKAAGIEVADFAFKLECCGAAFGVPKREMVNRLSGKVIEMAVDAGANCIVVACPLCQQNLDLRQEQINSVTGSKYNIPIVYFTQLLGLAFGMSPKELGMDKLFVNADKVTRRITKAEYDKMKEEEAAAKKAQKAKKPAAEETTN
jgi:heterodisulfide reductase subunit B